MRALLLLLFAGAASGKDFPDGTELERPLSAVKGKTAELRASILQEGHPETERSNHLLLWRGRATSAFTSPEYSVEPFDRAVLSWNVLGETRLELGVGDRWFTMARWGAHPPPAFGRRMDGLLDVEDEIIAGRPVIISVKGALLFTPNGHLIVVVGFDERGDVVVNDPARRGRVRRTYSREELSKAWMVNGSGIAYLFRP